MIIKARLPQSGRINAAQRLSGASFYASRPGLAVQAEIAFQRLYLPLLTCHLHRAKRAGQHAAFAPNTEGLFDVDRTAHPADRPHRADVGTGRIFTMVAGHCGG